MYKNISIIVANLHYIFLLGFIYKYIFLISKENAILAFTFIMNRIILGAISLSISIFLVGIILYILNLSSLRINIKIFLITMQVLFTIPEIVFFKFLGLISTFVIYSVLFVFFILYEDLNRYMKLFNNKNITSSNLYLKNAIIKNKNKLSIVVLTPLDSIEMANVCIENSIPILILFFILLSNINAYYNTSKSS